MIAWMSAWELFLLGWAIIFVWTLAGILMIIAYNAGKRRHQEIGRRQYRQYRRR